MTQRHPIQHSVTTLITLVTANRKTIFSHAAHAHEAIECLYRVQALHPFFLYAFVIMPDHCHFLMHVPAPQHLSNIIGAYKSDMTFDTGIPKLWQRRFHARAIKNIYQAVHYIHANPVRRGFCTHAEVYPWSSACGRWDVSAWSVL